MTVTVRLDLTHFEFPRDRNGQVGVRLNIVPEQGLEMKGVHIVILIDVSNSMKGDKLNTAIHSVTTLSSSLPPGNRLTIYKFAGKLEEIWSGETGQAITLPVLTVEPETRLHNALKKLAKTLPKMPTELIMLTDGQPTDEKDVKKYSKILPEYVRVTAIGIGRDYSEIILKRLSDDTAGLFHHIEMPGDLPTLFSRRSGEVYAYDLSISVPKQFFPLNTDLPIKIPVLNGFFQVLGFLNLERVNGNEEKFKFTLYYRDPAKGGQEETLSLEASLIRGEKDVVNQQVASEIMYYELLREYSEAIEQGRKAQEILEKLKEVAQETRRYDLIEQTQRLTGDPKSDLSQVTRTMRKS